MRDPLRLLALGTVVMAFIIRHVSRRIDTYLAATKNTDEKERAPFVRLAIDEIPQFLLGILPVAQDVRSVIKNLLGLRWLHIMPIDELIGVTTLPRIPIELRITPIRHIPAYFLYNHWC